MKKELDLLIQGGMIVDGSGSEPFSGDIGIEGDRIALVRGHAERNCPETLHAKEVIEAGDLIIAPGFIDTHAHSEFTLLADPRAEGKICQGITTEINGNCGLSAGPLYGEAFKQREGDLRELGIEERWTTLQEYLEILEQRGPFLNFATLAGHGNIRACVVGYRDKEPTPAESAEMRVLFGKALTDGAIGLSTGLIYPPGVYADTGELIDLCRVMTNKDGERPGIYTSHMRSEGDMLIESLHEVVEIGRASGVAVHVSHIKTSGERNWRKIDEALAVLERARGEGIAVTGDRYPYTASSTDLDTVLPAWVYEGGSDEELRKLKSDVLRARIKREVTDEHPDMQYWENTYVSSVASEKNRWMEGMSIALISQKEGAGPVDTVFNILIAEDLRVGAIFSSMKEENLRRFLSLAYVMIGTDSSARSVSGATRKGKPHPRGFGSFPRFLGKYVRDDSLMELGEAMRKITRFPAETFGIRERGIIRQGAFADVVVFDYRRMRDTATYSEPFLKPEGIHYVVVNGAPAVWEGQLTGVRAGRVLRHGG